MTFPSLMYTFFQRVNHLNRLFVIAVTAVATCIAYTYSTGNADPILARFTATVIFIVEDIFILCDFILL